jgi:hypothetical protein
MIRLKKKEEQNKIDPLIESDETFAYIAGYTSGGAPYGVTWDELKKDESRSWFDFFEGN